MIPPIVPSGIRIAATGLFRRAFGHRRYTGNAKQICAKIVRACFDDERGFFRTSLRTYRDFWSRDFGRCAPSLLSLGFREEVTRSYRFALEHYRRAERFALVIHPGGGLFDFPAYAPDGFAFFLNGLAALNDASLIDTYSGFLEKELKRFFRTSVDPRTGIVRSNRRFSEAQDYADRRGSCYSTVMCFTASCAADRLSLRNPLAQFDYPNIIQRNFWNGEYFYDDLSKKPYITGDACIMPFWAGVTERPEKLFPIVRERLDDAGLTRPVPLRYGAARGPRRPMIWLDKVNPWQRNAVWTCLGLQYLEVLRRLDPMRYPAALAQLEQTVETLGCFPEVIDPDTGGLYASAVYRAEDSMLWAADLLSLLEARDAQRKNARSEPPSIPSYTVH